MSKPVERLMITDTVKLAEFCQIAAQEEYISIDTEFVRESTYYPILCLVQIGLKEKAAVIDPLAKDIDLGPLFGLLQNPDVTKVFHAARQDIEIFYGLMGKPVTPLYDTQIAAMALGVNEQISYHALVSEFLGLDLDKGSRMTQWDKRPLSESQLDYAFMDVIPLYAIYPHQKAKLSERVEWVAEAYDRLTDPDVLLIKPENAWRMLKTKPLKPKQMGALAAIAQWREETAIRQDIPRRWVLADESVLLLAQSLPRNVVEAEKLRLKPKKIKNIDNLLRIMQKAESLVLPKRIPRPFPNEDLAQLFRLALHCCARKHNIAARLLCQADDILDLSGLKPGSERWLNHPLQQGWRKQIFGQFAEQIATGHVVLRFVDSQLEFIPISNIK